MLIPTLRSHRIKTHRRIFLLTCFLSFLACGLISGQIRPGIPPGNPNQGTIGSSAIRDTTPSEVLPLDTPVAMTYVLIADPDKNYVFNDTFLWNDNRHHPLQFHQSHLGNYGSPARTFTPTVNLKNGFSTGWDQYDFYFIHPDSFRYYHQRVPVAKIKYSQAGQDDNYITLDFGRSFVRGLSLSIAYDKINQLGEYMHQRQTNTSLGVGVWHNGVSGKYDAFYNYISNAVVGEENGGIATPDSIGLDIFPDPQLPVFIHAGVTTHKHRYFSTKQIFHLVSDSADFGIDLWLQGHFATGLFKYVDAAVSSDPLTEVYYGEEFFNDPRGVRQYTFQKEYQIEAGAALPWRAARSTIQSSLRYRTLELQQEPLERRINEMYLDASAQFRWVEPLELKGYLSLGLGQAAGTFAFKAEGSLNTGVLGRFEGHWTAMSRKPYMIESSLFVNQQPVYAFDFANPFSTEIGVGWNWEKQQLKAGIQWLVFDNFIYYDSNRKPVQLNESFSLRRFSASKTFDIKWMGVKGNIIWQPDAKEELAIPDLLYQASIYGRLRMFRKKATIMPGIDFIYHNGFRNVSYFPVTGRFHLANETMIPEYFRIDAALGVHINFLKMFIRFEDLVGLWDTRVLYEADFYPHYHGYMRIGVEAGFFN